MLFGSIAHATICAIYEMVIFDNLIQEAEGNRFEEKCK